MDDSREPVATSLVVKLQGGIGNQLFQLGFGDYLTKGFGHDVAYLTDAFATDPYRRANIVPQLFPEALLVQLPEIAGPGCRLLEESTLRGQLSLPNLRNLLNAEGINPCIFDGYWQDTRYISEAFVSQVCSGLLRHAQATGSIAAQNWANKIQRTINPIAVHVRRHDYKHHGICHEQYYVDALRWSLGQFAQSEAFVFSDEPNYTGHFLRNAGIAHHLVSTGDDLGDLYLMSQCKLHIIANSTYSWWGARLAGMCPALYPLPWSAIHTPTSHFFPAHWFSIEGAVSNSIEPISFSNALDNLSLATFPR